VLSEFEPVFAGRGLREQKVKSRFFRRHQRQNTGRRIESAHGFDILLPTDCGFLVCGFAATSQQKAHPAWRLVFAAGEAIA
jgi:hypothetical protein